MLDSLACSCAWKRLSRPGDKCGTTWRHASGWIVKHCGHHTALWPYYLIDPRHPERTVVSHNGLGFKSLKIAQSVVELLAVDRVKITTADCVEGIARVLLCANGKALTD